MSQRDPMELEPDLAQALDSPDPFTAVREVLIARMAAGRTRESLIQEVAEKLVAFGDENREPELELMIDASNLLEGWVALHQQIPDP